MSYTTARTNAARFRALTGVSVETFDTYLPYFTDTHDEYFRWHMLDGTKRSGTRPYTIQKNSPLTESQKEYNRGVSSIRVRVEHHIGSAKILKVIREECRLRKNRIVDGLFHKGAAIHNLRRGFKLRY